MFILLIVVYKTKLHHTERSSPPETLNITYINVRSFQLTWKVPSNPNGRIDYYNVSHTFL